MERIDKFENALYKVILNVSIAAFLMQCFLCILQVVARYVLKTSISFSEEFTRYLFIYTTYLGAIISLHKGKDIKMDLLISYMPKKVQECSHIISLLICIATYIIMIGSGLSVMRQTMDQTSAALKLPMGYVYMIVVIFGALALVFDILDNYRKSMKEEEK